MLDLDPNLLQNDYIKKIAKMHNIKESAGIETPKTIEKEMNSDLTSEVATMPFDPKEKIQMAKRVKFFPKVKVTKPIIKPKV